MKREKAVIGEFECYLKLNVPDKEIDGEPVTAVRFKLEASELRLLAAASAVQRFEVGAKYKLTLERV